jgi:hypothetical protein
MTNLSPECREVLINYLFEEGKHKISHAGPSMSDEFAALYVSELQDLGADEKAEELYQYYKEYWSGNPYKANLYELGA